MNNLIRFGFASRRRKIMLVILAVVGGISAFVSSGNDNKIVSEPVPVETTTNTYGPNTPWPDQPLRNPSGPVETTITSVNYANCTEVRNANKAPIYRGEPGYSTKLDRDGDGVACDQ